MSKTVAYKGYADAVKRFDFEPSPGRERNKFLYAKKRLMTFDAGSLTPFFWMPIQPADDLNYNVRALIRLSNALVSPLMDEIWINFYFFKSYNQFVFKDWKPFMGELIQDNPDYDSSGDNFGGQSLTDPPYVAPDEYQLPTLKVFGASGTNRPFEVQSLLDQLALPYAVGNDGYEIQSLVPRHYNLIYNEYFRDQNLQNFAPVPKDMGPDKISQFQLMPSSKYHDYFTASLPFLQKGPQVNIGLAGDVPVEFAQTPSVDPSSVSFPHFYDPQGTRFDTNNDAARYAYIGAHGDIRYNAQGPSGSSNAMNYVGVSATAKLSASDVVSLAQIRLGFQMQRFYEGQARSGTRYIEYVRFMFDEFIPDVELQRPQYIGGGKMLININPVAQTSNNSTEVSPLGTLAAFGVKFDPSVVRAHCHSREHGYVIGLLTVSTTQTYQQGLQRDWSYRDRFDFYVPTLAHLAEQPILNKELCTTGISAYDDDVFGYTGRYDEYRTMFGEVTGYFRSNAMIPGTTNLATLQSYHLSQFWSVDEPGLASDGFPGLPHLNANFIKQPKEVIDRVLNLTSNTPGVPQFLADIVTECRGVRCISKYGIPGFADHF